MGSPKACIFCGGVGKKLTRGHIIAEKMVSVLPQTPPGSPFMQKILVLNPAADGWVEASSRKPRSTSDMPVRIICEDCNGTWMNGYERTVIALMEAAQAGPSIRLDRGQQSALATWACIVAILSQYLSAQTQVTEEADRWFLYKHNQPPRGTHVWLGKSAEDPWMVWGGVHTFVVPLERRWPEERHSGLTINVPRYVYLLVIGPFALFVADLGPVPQPQLHTKPAGALHHIWPRPGTISWPTGPGVVVLDLDSLRRVVVQSLLTPYADPTPPLPS